jgi:lipopolysaccharide biosynthesis regulator YciM
MLSSEQRKRALYELGLDYMRAGLLDRAESLFLELKGNGHFARLSQRQLLDIFQQEKEWEKAIEIARGLNGRGDRSYAPLIAQYYCELAEKAFNSGEFGEAGRLLKRAFSEDRDCVRASMLEAKIAERQSQLRQAIQAYQRIEQQDSEYLPLIIEPLKHCYEQAGQMDAYTRYLTQLSDKEESITLILALSEQLCEQGQERLAMNKLLGYLQRRPSLRALDYLLELRHRYRVSGDAQELNTLHEVIHGLLEAKPVYRCGHCGFTSRSMLWQCPSCRQWGKVKPIQGIEGE